MGIERLAGLGLVDEKRPEGRQCEPALLLQFGDNGPDQIISGLGGGNAGAVQRVLENGGNEGFAHAGTGPCRGRFQKTVAAPCRPVTAQTHSTPMQVLLSRRPTPPETCCAFVSMPLSNRPR